jgi:hypothetical protein
MTANDIIKELPRLGSYRSILIPEFTWGDLRIDALLINFDKRLIRGFEIKVNRGDFIKDEKWALYSQFCSSLIIACPAELIKPEEVEKPFGLLWVYENIGPRGVEFDWIKRPKNFQKRNSLAWLWTYLKVMEEEFPRMSEELERVKRDNKYLQNALNKLEDFANKREEESCL